MSSNPTITALEEAICLEQEGLSFYQQAAKKTTDAKGREVFEYLAGEEANHERLIRRQLDELSQQKGWTSVGRPADCNLAESIFPPQRDQATQGNPDDLDALITGLEIETKSYDMYRKRADESTDPLAREMFEFLASQERLHFDLLMTNYTALSQFGGWSD